MSPYIFLLYYIYHLCLTCNDFYDLSAWGGCWFVVYIRRFIYKFLNVCPFDYKRLLRLVGRWARKPVNHTSWVAVVTPTDRPKSVRNRCLIELFCGVVCVVTLPFWHFCWFRGFCHRTESDLFLFLIKMLLKFCFVCPIQHLGKERNITCLQTPPSLYLIWLSFQNINIS